MCHSQSIDQLLEFSLFELLAAETAYLDTLSLISATAASHDLKQELCQIRAAAEDHLATLEQAAGFLEIDFRGKLQSGADASSGEIHQMAARNLDAAVLDIGLVHFCRRVESRRASCYRAAMDLAGAAGVYEIHDWLKAGEAKCLSTDWKLSTFADVLLSCLNPLPERLPVISFAVEIEIADVPVMEGVGVPSVTTAAVSLSDASAPAAKSRRKRRLNNLRSDAGKAA